MNEWRLEAEMWEFRGQKRPPFAIEPGPNQESVWDYPRPPRLERSARQVKVLSGSTIIARTGEAIRLLETASPPTYYLPPDAINFDLLVHVPGRSVCEWKGVARYFGLASDPGVVVAWSYEEPRGQYQVLRSYLSFYPGRITCEVDGQRVEPQSGLFYGGWVTPDLVGPFKGESGTGHW